MTNRVRGAAIVELAVVIPLVVGMLAFLLQTAQTSLLLSYAELALISAQFGYQYAPHRITPDPTTFEPGLKRLSSAEMADFISGLHSDLTSSFRGAGSFADERGNFAIELWYLDIDPDSGRLGGAGESWIRGSEPFFSGVGDAANDCFGSDRDVLQASFDRFVSDRLEKIKELEERGLPIGEKLLDDRLGGGNELYLESKSIIFVMSCARRPVPIIDSAPVTRTFVMFPDMEAAWD